MASQIEVTTTVTTQISVLAEPAPPPNCIPAKFLPGLDPEWIALYNEHGSKVIPASQVTVEEFRKCPQKYSFTYPTCRGPDVFSVRDIQVPVTAPEGEITCRVYTPEGAGPFPVHMNMHGGGWVLGSLTSEQSWCRHVCNAANMVVVDVAYRLAPEFRFPVAIDDCWDTLKWIIAHPHLLNITPHSVSLGGLSAGGHMGAVLAHLARDAGVALKLQLLTVPATDMRYCPLVVDGDVDAATCAYDSVVELADMPWGPVGRESWFLNYFIGSESETREKRLADWRMTPVLAESFADLAPAFIVTAEFDVERDEGEYYGRLLKEAGNEVLVKRYLGVPHAFAHYNCPERGLAKAQEYIRDTCEVLRRAHAGEPLGLETK